MATETANEVADVYRSYIATLQTSIDGYKEQVSVLQTSLDALRDSVALLRNELAGSGNYLMLLCSPYGVVLVTIVCVAVLVIVSRNGFKISKGDASISVGDPEDKK